MLCLCLSSQLQPQVHIIEIRDQTFINIAIERLRANHRILLMFSFFFETSYDSVWRPLIFQDMLRDILDEGFHLQELPLGLAGTPMSFIEKLSGFGIIVVCVDPLAIDELDLSHGPSFDLIVDCAMAALKLFRDETMGFIESFQNLDFNSFFESEVLSFVQGHCIIEVHHSWILSHVFRNLMILGFRAWCFFNF
jgi:hypothetical protein